MLCLLFSTTNKTVTLFVCEKGIPWGFKFVISTSCTYKPRVFTHLSSSSCISMSITYCLLLFIIMGLSLHICDGRHLADMNKKLAKRATSSSKSGVKTGLDLVNITSNFQSMQRNSSLKSEGNNAESQVAEKAILLTATAQKLTKTRKEAKGKIKGPSHNHQKLSSLGSVSWRLPRKIPIEEHPGLDSDYCPPRTHPPSHN